MPKTLVLFTSPADPTDDIAVHAAAVAEGARSVRFSEVTVRRLDDPSMASDPPEDLASYDGIIVGSVPDDDDTAVEVARLLEQIGVLRASGALANAVGSAFTLGPASGSAAWPILTSLGRTGLILVPPGSNVDAMAAAREQGRRVAEVVSWVTHARSHTHAH